jgi:C4-dicarboxylate transporter DctM subunit
MASLTTKNVLLAIPFFVVSGAIMSAGDIANRLVGVAKAFTGSLPGGLAIATVGGCVFFAAISGSSPVTVIAIGSIMVPALRRAGYDDKFSIGLLTTAGSLGILIPPSIPMLVFAIVAGASAPVDIGELFMAGLLPGLFIGGLLALYSMIVAGRAGSVGRTPFSFAEVGKAVRHGMWAILLPVLILGGIYSGVFTATEAAAVSVIYALVVELYIHRTIGWGHLPKILAESAVMMGTLIIIMVLAFGLNDFLVEEKVPDRAVAWIQSMDLDALEFLLGINLLLLVVGCLMDSISAILIIAPLLTPIAVKLGIDPIHLGVVFIVNLEIGYLTPPIGLNLFVSSSVFDKPLGMVIRSVVPFIGVMMVGLAVITYVPSVALGPVNVLMRDKPFYEPLPDPDRKKRDGPKILEPGQGEGDKRVRTMQEITTLTEELYGICDVAEAVNKDAKLPPGAKAAKWRSEFGEAEIDDPTVLALADEAMKAAGTPAAYAKLREQATEILKDDYECAALETMLAVPAGDAPPPVEDEEEEEDEEEDVVGPMKGPPGLAPPTKAGADAADAADEDDDDDDVVGPMKGPGKLPGKPTK